MTAQEEKELRLKVAMLERQVTEIREHLGMDAVEREKMEYEIAIDLARTGDTSLLKEHLRKVNSKKTG